MHKIPKTFYLTSAHQQELKLILSQLNDFSPIQLINIAMSIGFKQLLGKYGKLIKNIGDPTTEEVDKAITKTKKEGFAGVEGLHALYLANLPKPPNKTNE